MCAFVVLGLVFPYQTNRLAWRMSLQWPISFRWEVKPQLNQSINQDMRWPSWTQNYCLVWIITADELLKW